MTDAQLKQKLTIYPKAGSQDSSALFANLYLGRTPVKREEPEPKPGAHGEIIARVNQALDYTLPAWTIASYEKNGMACPGAAVSPAPQRTAPPPPTTYAHLSELVPITQALTNAGLSKQERLAWLQEQGYSNPKQIPAAAIRELTTAAQAAAKAAGEVVNA